MTLPYAKSSVKVCEPSALLKLLEEENLELPDLDTGKLKGISKIMDGGDDT